MWQCSRPSHKKREPMANQITGRIYRLGPTQQITTKRGSTFARRDLVIDATRFDVVTGDKMFDNLPMLEAGGDKLCAELDAYKEGDLVRVSFDLYGSEYRDRQTGEVRYFTRVRAYRIERVEKPQAQSPAPSTPVEPYDQVF